MADINRIVLTGRLTKDVEVKYTGNGMAIGSGTIAIDRSVKKEGEWMKEANFFDFTIFGKSAENLQQFLTKGKQIGIDGFLKQDRWQDQNGQNRSKISVVANDIQLLGGKSAGGNNQQQEAGYGYDEGYNG